MKQTPTWLVLLTGLLLISLSPGCGGSGSDTQDLNNHSVQHLLGVQISPPTADAKDYRNGIVFFAFNEIWTPDPSGVAAGTRVAPVATWCVAKSANTCAGINDVMNAVIVTQKLSAVTTDGTGDEGLTTCAPGFAGQVTILAGETSSNGDMTAYRVANPQPFAAGSYATATLTCP